MQLEESARHSSWLGTTYEEEKRASLPPSGCKLASPKWHLRRNGPMLSVVS